MNMFELVMKIFAQKDTNPGGGYSMFIFLAGLIVLMYFFMLRPQSKQRKEHQKMLELLKKGDKIVTIGGIYGIVTNVKDKIITVRISENVKVEMLRSGIAQVVSSKDEVKEESPQQLEQ